MDMEQNFLLHRIMLSELEEPHYRSILIIAMHQKQYGMVPAAVAAHMNLPMRGNKIWAIGISLIVEHIAASVIFQQMQIQIPVQQYLTLQRSMGLADGIK